MRPSDSSKPVILQVRVEVLVECVRSQGLGVYLFFFCLLTCYLVYQGSCAW